MIERLAVWTRSCMAMQGYGALSDEDRKGLWLGIRFAPMLCFVGIALGVVLASPVLLAAMAVAAFVGGFITPKHPFDYLYDVALRPLLGGPSVPPSPAPRRFACQLATPWIVAIAIAFLAGLTTVAWVLAVPLLVVAATVASTNWCLPSLIYGLLHGQRAGAAPSR